MATYYLNILQEYYPENLKQKFWEESIECIDYSRPLTDIQSLMDILHSISDLFNLGLEVVYLDENFDELDRGMPLSCDILNAENKELFQIGISHFGMKNIDIALNEAVLLLVQEKLFKDGRIPFDDDFINDDEDFIPFLVVASVYFGFLLPLIYRINVVGEYTFPSSVNYSYTYHLPIDKEVFLETIVLMSRYKSIDLSHIIDKLEFLDKNLKRELLKTEKRC